MKETWELSRRANLPLYFVGFRMIEFRRSVDLSQHETIREQSEYFIRNISVLRVHMI